MNKTKQELVDELNIEIEKMQVFLASSILDDSPDEKSKIQKILDKCLSAKKLNSYLDLVLAIGLVKNNN